MDARHRDLDRPPDQDHDELHLRAVQVQRSLQVHEHQRGLDLLPADQHLHVPGSHVHRIGCECHLRGQLGRLLLPATRHPQHAQAVRLLDYPLHQLRAHLSHGNT